MLRREGRESTRMIRMAPRASRDHERRQPKTPRINIVLPTSAERRSRPMPYVEQRHRQRGKRRIVGHRASSIIRDWAPP
jgi:hypothetical protein